MILKEELRQVLVVPGPSFSLKVREGCQREVCTEPGLYSFGQSGSTPPFSGVLETALASDGADKVFLLNPAWAKGGQQGFFLEVKEPCRCSWERWQLGRGTVS